MIRLKYPVLSLALLLALSTSSFADNIDDSFNFNNTDIGISYSLSTSDDSTSMVINPGGIGLKGEGELFFSNSITGLQQTNLFGTFGNFNFGYQQFTPEGSVLPPLRKYIVGAGYPIIRNLSLGVTYFNVQSTDQSQLSASSVDIGLLTRPFEFLSIGFALRNLTTPFLGEREIKRNYNLGIGFRPASFDRITVTLDGNWVEGSPANRIRGSLGLETEPINGVHLRGKVYSDASFSNFSWSLNAGVSFPYVSLGYFRLFPSVAANTKDAVYGRFSLNKERTIFEGSNIRLAEIKIKNKIEAVKDTDIDIFSIDPKNSVYDYLESINRAEKDKDIAGIVLNIDSFSSGLAVNEEIRNKISDFKKSGKKVIAYIKTPDFSDYYLASVADYIIMHPLGEIQLTGINSTHTFYKGLFDKLGIKAEFERIGKYKSAVEPFTRTNASDELKEQTNSLLEDFYSHISEAITSNRKINKDELKHIIDNKTMISSDEAIDLKLIDKVGYEDEIGELSAKLFKLEGEFPLVDISKRKYRTYKWLEEDRIAIINAEGTIVQGSSTRDFFSGETTMGADTISTMLNKARKDDSVKAVVLRVNSGGGSALASDIIGRAIDMYKESKKPIVISMANVAGSGGYWITVNADKIIANENTITGSIGVFTGKVSFKELYDKLGINTDTMKIGKHADAFEQNRSFTQEERKILFDSAQNIYRLFIERVSKGRNIPVSKVDDLGQGRIYSGKKAKDLKLIDETGGLEKAIEIAKSLSKLDKKNVEILNVKPGLDVLSKLPTNQNQAFYPLVLYKMINNEKVLVLTPDFENNF